MSVLHHSSIRVRDVERSRLFYERLLGFAAVERPDLGFPGMWYGLGNGQLHLIQAPRMFPTIDPGDPHVAITVDDLDAMRAVFRKAGIEILDFGGNQIWVHDPDGNTIELRKDE